MNETSQIKVKLCKSDFGIAIQHLMEIIHNLQIIFIIFKPTAEETSKVVSVSAGKSLKRKEITR